MMLFSCCIKSEKQESHDSNMSKQGCRNKLLSQIVVTQPSSASSRQHEVGPLNSNNIEFKHEIKSNASKKQAKRSLNDVKTSTTTKNQERQSVEQYAPIGRLNENWIKQQKRKILYCNSTADSEMLLFYKIDSICDDQQNLKQCIFQNNTKSSSRLQSCDFTLIITSKITRRLINYLNQHYQATSIIIGITNQNGHSTNFLQHSFQVVMIKAKCFDFNRTKNIILYLEQYSDINRLQNFILPIVGHFSLNNLLQLQFMLPPWISLNEISSLLSKLLISHARPMKCPSFSIFLNYNIEITNKDTQPQLLLYAGHKFQADHQNSHQIFEDKIFLAMNLLGAALDYSNIEIYYKIIDKVISDLTLLEYMKIFNLLHEDKKKFVSVLRGLGIYTQDELYLIHSIQKTHKIEPLHQGKHLIALNRASIHKMHQMFKEFHQSPELKQSFRKIMEWDDDLTASQILKESDPISNTISVESPRKYMGRQNEIDPAQLLNCSY